MTDLKIPADAEPLVALADAKLFHAIQLGQWVDRGPTMEECIALSSISQDELGHARAFYDLAHQAGAPSVLQLQYDRPSTEFRPPPALLVPRTDWPTVVLSISLLDRVLLHQVRADGRVAPLRAKLEQEERFHLHHGDAWLQGLAADPATRPELEAALAALWPAVAQWLHALPSPVRTAALDECVPVLEAASLRPAAARKGALWVVEPAAGPALDQRVEGLVADTRVEIVAMLQDPAARAIADAFGPGG